MNTAPLSVKERDYNKPSEVLALELIYAANRYKPPVGKIKLGLPSALDQRPDIASDENTYVPASIDNVYDGRFSPQSGFRYQRLSLGVLKAINDVRITPPFYPFKTHDVLDQINAQLSVQFSEQDIVNDLYSGDNVAFKITAHPHSLVWLGGKELYIGDYEARFLIKTTRLVGFTEYVAGV